MKYAILLFIFSLLITVTINFIALRFKFLIYKPDLNHKEIFNNIILNTGGIILFLYLIIINIYTFALSDIYYHLFLISIFFVGILSDIKNINANLRLIIISFLCFLFIILTGNEILDLKFDLINYIFINYPIIATIFTSLCLIILINGTNFVDGVHGLVILYGIIILLFLNYFLFYTLNSNYLIQNSLEIIPVLLILLILNFREKIFFGDSGSYLLGAVIGLYIIKTCNMQEYSYPYFYANLLIYPAYEVFFSIFRKILTKKNPYQPDKKHLHHLIQNFYLKNYKLSLSFSKILSATTINIVIIFFNLISVNFYQDKFILILNIFCFAILYSVSYFILNKNDSRSFL